MINHRYFLVHKPFNMVSQFISSHEVPLLGDLDFDFPEGTHAIGRLDKNSEGLLLLTTNSKVTRLLFHGEEPHTRKYLVQMNKSISDENINRLTNGIAISAPDGNLYVTQPCIVERVEKPDYIQHLSSIILHQNVTNSWITITLTEGKYHQVRKMIKAIKHKCLRLIRIGIEDIRLDDIKMGEVKEVDEAFFFSQLKL